MRQVLSVVPGVSAASGSDWVAITHRRRDTRHRNRIVLSSPRVFRVPQPSVSRRSSIALSPEAAKSAILFLVWFCPESAIAWMPEKSQSESRLKYIFLLTARMLSYYSQSDAPLTLLRRPLLRGPQNGSWAIVHA